MKFSIIVIAYNQKETICAAIDSVLQQTYRELEVIYVDDASTDGSAALVKACFPDSRLRVIEHKENQGCVISRLDGAACASGDWVMFLDGDDTFREDACTVLEEAIQNSQPGVDNIGFGAELLYTGPTEEDAKKEIKRLTEEPCLGYFSGEELMEELYLKRNKAWLVWNKCYSRALIQKAAAAAKREKLVQLEDFYLSFLICDMTERYFGIPQQLYRYAFGSGISSSQKLSFNAFIQYLTAVRSPELAAEYAKARGIFDKFSPAFEAVAREVMLGSYYKLCRIPDEEKPMAALRYFETFGKYLENIYYDIQGKNEAVKDGLERIGQLEDAIRLKYGELDECRAYIKKLEERISGQQEYIQKLENNVRQKQEYIQQLEDNVLMKCGELDECRAYIKKLEERVCSQQETLQQIYDSKAYRMIKFFQPKDED